MTKHSNTYKPPKVTPDLDRTIVMSVRIPISLLIRAEEEMHKRRIEGMISATIRSSGSPSSLFLDAITHYMEYCESERAQGRSPLGLPPPRPKRPRGRPKKTEPPQTVPTMPAESEK